MTNAERQRRFQEAHPGYDRRRKATQRASAKRCAAQLLAAQAVAVAPARREPLMLPAPVQDPTTDAINALVASLSFESTPELAPIPARPTSAANAMHIA